MRTLLTMLPVFLALAWALTRYEPEIERGMERLDEWVKRGEGGGEGKAGNRRGRGRGRG